jgi:methyl-accepting chemotaxis protein
MAAAQDNFNNTANIIKSDLLLLERNQIQTSGNLVRSTKMGDKVKFISDYSGGDQFSLTKDSYQQLVSSMVQTVSQEIAVNVNQASQGIQEVNSKVVDSSVSFDHVASNLVHMNKVSSIMSQQCSQVSNNTLITSSLADRLKKLVEQFKLDDKI